MNSDDDNKPVNSPLAKTLLASVLLVLIAIAGLLLSRSEWRLAPEPVLASEELPGGDFLVHRAELGESMAIEGLEKVGGFRAPWYDDAKTELFGSNYSHEFAGSHGFGLRMLLEGDEDRLKTAEFSLSPDHEGLLLLVTAQDAQGEPISSDLLCDKGRLFKIERNPTGILTKTESWDKASSDRPTYSLEVEDGSGGWLPMLGPIIVREADGRAFFSARVFPRTPPKLKLRATIGTEKPVVLEIPNPGYRSSIPALTTDFAPFERDLGEVTVRLREAVIKPGRVGQAPYPKISWQIEPNEGNPQAASAYLFSHEAIEDQVGNSLMRGPLLPGTRQIRVVGQVVLSSHYSYPREDSLIIAEATWGDGKRPLVFNLATEATDSGVQTIVLKPGKGESETTFQLDAVAEYPEKGRSPVVESLGSGRHPLCFFVGEEPLSRKTAGRSDWSSTVIGAGESRKYRAKMSFEWRLEDGAQPKPGQTIRIGIAPDIPSLPFEFVLPAEVFKK